MPNGFRRWLRCALLLLLMLGLPAHAKGTIARWAGSYIAGSSRLTLGATGRFDYDGGGCFPRHSNSDVGFLDAFHGRYRVKGHWIVLEPANAGYNSACSGISLRLFAYRIGAHRYLFDEQYLRRVAHDVRRGADPKVYNAWHIADGPPAISRAALAWLPEPFAHMARMRPPSGQVVVVGPVQRQTLYGAAGRVDGEVLLATLTLDFGRDQGAFAGMPVCVPGSAGTLLLESAGENTSTLRWTWATTGAGAPRVGDRFESACDDSPERASRK